MGELTITSLNCNGLLSQFKQKAISNYCIANGIDVLFLQETHVSNLKLARYVQSFMKCKDSRWSFYNNHSSGVSILFFIDVDITKYFYDLDGRFVYVDCKIKNCDFRLLNVYAPNNECDRKLFFQDIVPHIVTKRHIVLGVILTVYIILD